jgi:hypothetical protein
LKDLLALEPVATTSLDAATSSLDAATSSLDAATSSLDAATSSLDVATTSLDVETAQALDDVEVMSEEEMDALVTAQLDRLQQ